jgi:allantoinase
MNNVTLIKNGKVALPGGKDFTVLDIRIRGEKIDAVGKNLSNQGDVLEAQGLYVLPGGIDPHVHFDDPGYTRREDFYHGTCAAASGGITTIIDMPCTSVPPVTNRKNLLSKLKVIEKKAVVDYGLYGGVSADSFQKGYARFMEELAEWVLGFKTYFMSGMTTFQRLNLYQFQRVLEKSRELNLPVLVHAEDHDYVTAATRSMIKAGKNPIHYYLSRPEMAEQLAAQNAIELANQADADLHIVHVGTAEAASMLYKKGRNSKITCETGPQYLAFDLEDFKQRGSVLKVAPPLKAADNKDQLWQLLAVDIINFVASDHAPCSKSEKETGSVWTDYAGIPGCGTLLPYMFSEGYGKERLTLRRFLEVTSENAARRYGLFDRKGSIEPGKDADLVLIDPTAAWKVEGRNFLSKGKVTPFEGTTFKGRVFKTILRGRVIYDAERGVTAEKGYGRLLRKNGTKNT